MKRLSDPRVPLGIRMPTLILAAGADPVCGTPATERFAARLKAGHAIVLPGARHEIMMERDAVRDLFWAAFDAFVPGTPDHGAPPQPEFVAADLEEDDPVPAPSHAPPPAPADADGALVPT
jgi:lysophospholipase